MPVTKLPFCTNSPTEISPGSALEKLTAHRPLMFFCALLIVAKRSLPGLALKGNIWFLTAPLFIHRPLKIPLWYTNLNCDSNTGICTKNESPDATILLTRNFSAAFFMYHTGLPFSVFHSKVKTMLLPSSLCNCACQLPCCAWATVKVNAPKSKINIRMRKILGLCIAMYVGSSNPIKSGCLTTQSLVC